MMEDSMVGNGRRVVLGDVNCNTADVRGEEASLLREMLDMRDMVAMGQGGDWALMATREPRGKQLGEPSHIDMVAVPLWMVSNHGAKVTQVGLGGGLDDGNKPMTDHKGIVMTMRQGLKKVAKQQKQQRIAYNVVRVHEDSSLEGQFKAAVQAQPGYRKVVMGGMSGDERMRIYHNAAA